MALATITSEGTISPRSLEPTTDRPYEAKSGWAMLLAGVAGLLLFMLSLLEIFGIVHLLGTHGPIQFAVPAILLPASGFVLAGVTILQPRQAMVLTWFGSYLGTFGKPGIWWINPLTGGHIVSTAVHSDETKTITVNDLVGNPITIAALFVWRVEDAARATFDVPQYESFVTMQAEAALRHIASTRPYDEAEVEQAKEAAKIDPGVEAPPREAANVPSLRSNRDAVNEELIKELETRAAAAGVVVDEVRLTHLAYAPEIAGAMLKRQQAGALVAARRLMVEGAVGIVMDTIEKLEAPAEGKKAIRFDDDRRATMAQNLLVMVVGDREATPVLNVGTLHS